MTSALKNRDAITGGGLFHVAQDVLAEPVAVGQDFIERHRGERAPGRELNVAIKPLLVFLDLVDRGARVGDAELHDDADPDRDFVGGEDFLALDGQLALADVNELDLD